MTAKVYILIIGLIIFLSAFIDLGNWWEYVFLLVNAICWLVVYAILAKWYIASVGHRNCLKWRNFVYTCLLSIIIASGILDVIFQCQATLVRIRVGEAVRGFDYYSIAARGIDSIQPLYHCSYYFALALMSIAIFLFVFCSGYLYRRE